MTPAPPTLHASVSPNAALRALMPNGPTERVASADLSSISLRTLRRALAINALVACMVVPEVSMVAGFALIALCLMELWVPAHRYCREPAFQNFVAVMSFLTLPIFLIVYSGANSGNPLIDALLSFLILFHVKWVYAPRRDFHWLASLMVYAIVGLRSSDALLGLCLVIFAVLSALYLAGAQDPAEGRRDYLLTLAQRRLIRRRLVPWTLPLLVLTLIIFLLFPRFPPPRPWNGAQQYTGIVDSLSLANQGPLSLDPKVVGYFELLEGSVEPQKLYLRTGHLDAILEENWTFYRISHQHALVPVFRLEPWATPDMPDATVFYQDFRPWRRPDHQTQAITFRFNVTDHEVTFAAMPYGTYEWEVPNPGRLVHTSSDFYEIRNITPPYTMQGRALTSHFSDLGWIVYPHLEPGALGYLERRYLTALPEPLRIPQLRHLAGVATRDVDTPRLKAARIAHVLQRNYRYSLNPPNRPGTQNPIADFLLLDEYGEGYCEMFAAAMVVLLRNLDIPARVAVGFSGSEPVNGEPGLLRIRRSNAHAWVEAWIDGEGWMAFDPTPPMQFQSFQNREGFKIIRTWTDDVQRHWRDAIVNYDHVRQAAYLRGLTGALMVNARQWRDDFDALTSGGGESSGRRSEAITRVSGLAMAVVALGVGLLAVLRFRMGLFSRRPPASPASLAQRHAADFWRRVERALVIIPGRSPAVTPRAHLMRYLTRAPERGAAVGSALRYYEQLAAGLVVRDAMVEQRLLDELR